MSSSPDPSPQGSPPGPGALPLLALLSAAAARRVATVPPVALPAGQLTVTGLVLRSEEVVVGLSGRGPLGITTEGTVTARLAEVGADQARFDLHADGGLAFRTAVNAALTAGGFLEPLLRTLTGRPLAEGITLSGGQLRLSYAALVDALAETE
jgi:MYXO-CTERM domain-containing protein